MVAMKTKIQWLPVSLWLMMIFVWLNGNISNFLKSRVSGFVYLIWYILAIYSTLLIFITFYYWLFENELKVERGGIDER